MTRWLPKETRDKLPAKIAYLKEIKGLGMDKIAERLNMSQSRVDFYWKKYKETRNKALAFLKEMEK